MRRHVQRPKAGRQPASAEPKTPRRPHRGPDRSAVSILDRQASAGNHAVQRLLEATRGPDKIQTKLRIDAPGDSYEQEADRIADRLMRMPEPPVERPEPGRLQARRLGSGATGATAAPSAIDDVLRSPGQPLDPAARVFMERRFGHDLGQVRVHADARAAESSRAVNARAFTVGRDVVFGAGEYAPRSSTGRQLLAHELAHVLQNNATSGYRDHSAANDAVLRYTLDDCEASDRDAIHAADARATVMADKAESTLRKYRSDDLVGVADQKVGDLLADNFGFSGAGGFLDEVIDGYREIHDEFAEDDYQYECEDDCDSAYAYVYGIWTDIHLCFNKLRGRSTTFMAGVMLHEMSHYTAGTDDIQYFYLGSRATTTLRAEDAISNADSYEGFAEELYKSS